MLHTHTHEGGFRCNEDWQRVGRSRSLMASKIGFSSLQITTVVHSFMTLLYFISAVTIPSYFFFVFVFGTQVYQTTQK